MNRTTIILFLVLPFLSQSRDAFNRFIYCRDTLSGTYEKQCVDLKPDGTGESRFKRRGADEAVSTIALSAPGRERFLSVIAGTKNLEDRQKYESKRRVANLGRKHITLEMASEKREAEFNYSDLKEVMALATFFDGLIHQLTFVQDLESAVRYERLSVPERLEQLQGDLKSGRIGDPHALIPVLEKVVQDQRILEYARQHAQQIVSQIQVSK